MKKLALFAAFVPAARQHWNYVYLSLTKTCQRGRPFTTKMQSSCVTINRVPG
jgi:hypothetical protein